MATNTYTALVSTTLSSSAATVTFDLTGVTGYTDLVLACNPIYDTTTANIQLYYNGDTGANYSTTVLAGNGSGAVSTRFSSQSNGWLTDYYGATASEPFTKIIHIMNYANTTTYKTGIARNSSGREAMAGVGLWRSTAAITSLTLKQGGNFLSGSKFTLYGITAASAPTAKATGGTITYDVGYTYHTFTSAGAFVPSQDLSVDYLVIAGGASGAKGTPGVCYGAGGGAGGVSSGTYSATNGTSYTVLIGAGGAGSAGVATKANGNSSSAFGVTSGGGQGGNATASTGAGGTSGTPQANTGGTYTVQPSGGGGGAGAATTDKYGGSGIGTFSSWAATTGTGVGGYYAGGGGGSSDGGGWAGGSGGGGTGAQGGGTPTSGTANTGSGGGSMRGDDAPAAGSGGSGIVIIRYAN